ncbi:MAG: hypothetical protein A3F84_28110 [Candidatus Handelsmanbacteria bacterium RIFCSPLOWO2_12_FULL_64_10]|uniref:Uncharacterized protein n=1 Tax=Handelsmanbacteria sp. (strain RIFCSPLOWO2_12_FULL_64_10) TaxID=1817868 RepID=A0A1F6CJ13_HANXR|nr:MAG: hypothetical protein A3F84_28110 [Candidatus Handelsmanbacteria bacterium RIFCSPLOWO2_12_FULL_64_10]
MSLIGFLLTIRQVRRARKATELAREEVSKARADIIRSHTLVDFSQAISLIQDIKRLHRTGEWPPLLDRYSALRKILVAIKASTPRMPQESLHVVQESLQQLIVIEDEVERALHRKRTPSNPVRMNRIMSEQIDKLVELLESMTHNSGGNNG